MPTPPGFGAAGRGALSELSGQWNAGFDPIKRQQRVNERRLGAEACQQREIDVVGDSRLTPFLHGEATDETKPPALAAAELRQSHCRVEYVVGNDFVRWHARSPASACEDLIEFHQP